MAGIFSLFGTKKKRRKKSTTQTATHFGRLAKKYQRKSGTNKPIGSWPAKGGHTLKARKGKRRKPAPFRL